MGGEDTPYPHWAELVDACEDYAALSGWRFVRSDFMRLDDDPPSANAATGKREKEEKAARARAMPVALDFGDRVRALASAPPRARDSDPLYGEFALCQKLVASEAIYNSMLATCKALGVLPPPEGSLGQGEGSPAASSTRARPSALSPRASAPVGPEMSYQDTSQPLPVIAQRLANYHAMVASRPAVAAHRRDRLLHASFIVDFGLEHGLPEHRDATCEGMLREFLERVKEWGGSDPSSQDLVRSLVLDGLGPGQARSPALREAALDWFEHNKSTAIVGGFVVAGALGVLVAGATILAAGARGKR